ncbi:hypothetical protein EPIR_3171 [Erwinia piriflorinigrans CFBP 5888]|uniref:Uncharacterized protein n=1 Tax=Erwinia piriflorinigrans CFBP 5888 TaxID=1161919 RepID=V5ZC68_9GAMM|nr:hypothetical protein EPIR_3171 [Erwinia piriflorinigrans CFBP 5888]
MHFIFNLLKKHYLRMTFGNVYPEKAGFDTDK